MHSTLLTAFAFAALSVTAASAQTTQANPTEIQSTARGLMAAQTGSVTDFEYFAGAWKTRQHRLKVRGVGSTEWEDFPGVLCMSPYLGGLMTVDELYFPTKDWAGVTIRAFNLATKQWSIYWISSATGKLEPPVVGGFDGDRGVFYGEDQDGGRPVVARFTWKKIDRDHARWEQAFSYDGRAWETNWTADFDRADPTTTCEAGRPQR